MITTPGKYRELGGGMATVTFVDHNEGIAFGKCSNGTWTSYGLKGGYYCDPPVEHRLDIVSPWIDEPDPGEGWRLLQDDESVMDGDQFCFYKNAIKPSPHSYYIDVPVDKHGKTAAEIRASDPIAYRDDPRVFRRRIDPPFLISDKGLGVYETRDGIEKKIVSTASRKWRGALYSWADDCGWTYRDDGVVCHENLKSPADIVRYLRPLDETWTPTPELAQRWTCGDKSEWRSIPVSKE